MDVVLARMLASMRRSQLEAEVITFSASMSACEKEHRWEQAWSLFPSASTGACEKGQQWEQTSSSLPEFPDWSRT